MAWILKYNSNTVLVWLSLLLLKHPIFIRKFKVENTIISSSVWCTPSNFGKSCTFNNLCYNPELNSFLFILGKDTIISGIKDRKQLREINTSWLNHSHFNLKLALVDTIGVHQLITDESFILSRFKPDNIMHVIHDDLLPLYVTYKRICAGKVNYCSSKILIALWDSYDSNFLRLYEAFTYKAIIHLNTLNSVVCFSHVHIGLDSDSIFYQYGFDKPHGAVLPVISGEVIFEFSEYILKFFNIKRVLNSNCTFIGRKINRKILNEKFLIELIKDVHFRKLKHNIFVNNLDISTQSLEEVIHSVASSKLLLGMHGAGMILAMFLPRGAVTIELFPYAIVKEHVSAIYSMSKIGGIYFSYLSWRNSKKENSLRHPEYPLLLGGTNTMTLYEKKLISETTLVPPVICCHDPLYLHFMFQDTFVDLSIVPILEESFKTSIVSNVMELMHKIWYYPSQVRNINCILNSSHLLISWEPPFNVRNLTEIFYKITLSTQENNSTFLIEHSNISVIPPYISNSVSVWIQCIINEIEGDDSHFVCTN